MKLPIEMKNDALTLERPLATLPGMDTARPGPPTTPEAWWAVALTEQVTGEKPHAGMCEGHELVLFRDARGAAVALEDRCPHRRMPLSEGSLKEGRVQCAYHGWTFDGHSGACTTIPNLGTHESVPKRYGAKAYPVRELGGFVYVWLGAEPPMGEGPAPTPSPLGVETASAITGSAIVSLARSEYLAAVFDGPEALLGFDGVHISDFFLGDARAEGDSLVLDRGAVWSGQRPGPDFVTDHALIVRTALPLSGGLISVQLLTAEALPIVTVHIAACANRRGTTRLSWRGMLHTTQVNGAPLRWRSARAIGRAPFKVFPAVDGATVAALRVEPSQEFRAARTRAHVAALGAV